MQEVQVVAVELHAEHGLVQFEATQEPEIKSNPVSHVVHVLPSVHDKQFAEHCKH